MFLNPASCFRHGISWFWLVTGILCYGLCSFCFADTRTIAFTADLDQATVQRYLEQDPDNALLRLVLAERKLRSDRLAANALLDLDRDRLSADLKLYLDALLCRFELYSGTNPRALTVCNQLSVDESAPIDPYVLAQATHSRAMQAFSTGDVWSTLQRSHEAIDAARRSGSRRALINALNANAVALHSAGVVERALRQFEEARRLIDPDIDQDLLHTLTLNNGTALIYAGQGDEARSTFEAALADPANTAPTLQLKIRNNLAEAYLLSADHAAAIAVLENYLTQLAPDAVGVEAQLRARMTLGEAKLESGNINGALQLYEDTQLELDALLSLDQRMLLQRAEAAVQLSLGNLGTALQALEKVTEHFRKQNADWQLLPALESLALAYAQSGRYEEAFNIQQEHASLKSSLDTARFDQQLAVQHMQLEADNAEYQQRLKEQAARAQATKNSLDQTRWVTTTLLLALVIALLYLLVNRHLRNRELAAKASESAELERLVIERTNDLENELSARLLLQDERQQLEIKVAENDKLRTIGQLTSGVAHDFNNLMTVVTLSAELIDLEADRLSTRQSQALKDIMSATNSAATITSQLLAYARQQPLQPEQLNLKDYLTESRTLFQSTLGEQLSLKLRAVDCWVEVDRANLTTALLHLLSNAKDAIAGPGQVEINVNRMSLQDGSEQSTSWAALRVADTGSGMSAVARERAIEPFFTTKTQENRSGLGLSMAFGFAQQSGGDLKIQDSAAGGTEVTLYLPLSSGIKTPQNLSQVPRLDAPVAGRVLLVEDKPELRTALARLIEAMGLRVATAEDADSALACLRQEPLPDLLLSDIVMPGSLNGKELADAAIARHPGLRVLLMSGFSDVASGNYPLLRKPFSLDELRAEIRAQLPESCAA